MRSLTRLLLLTFPATFRRRFGEDMTAVLTDRWHAARRAGLVATMTFWPRAAADAIRHGMAERSAERCATSGRDSMLRSLLQDVRYALRTLGKQRGVTLTIVATLALGIGATTAVYSVADALMLRPLPFPNADRLVSLQSVNQERGFSGNVAVPDFDDWRAGVDAIDAGAAWTASEANLAGLDGAERVSAGLVTGEFFSLVGATPTLGRVFGDDARTPGLEHVVVLSEGAWARLYGRSPDAVGRTAVLDGVAHAVVGVVPAVAGLDHIEVWRPLARTGAASARTNHAYRAYARLKPDVTVEQATAQFNAVAARLEAEYPESNHGWRVSLTPLQEELTAGLNQAVTLVGAIVVLLLLIACSNVAGLLMSRAADRRREFAVRTALGAGRRRIVRQILTECVVLGVMGGAAGLAVAWWSTDALTAVLASDEGLWRTPTLSVQVLAFATVMSVATGLLFGLAPALTLGTARPQQQLRSAGSGAGRSGRRTRSTMAFVQMAIASVLLVGAALLTTSLYRALQVDPGFDPDNVMTFRVTAPAATYGEGQALTQFFSTLTERLGALPQVASAGVMSSLPMAGNSTIRQVIRVDEPVPERGNERWVLYQVSSPGYVAASGMGLLAGRDFSAADRETSPPVALVNESLARALWPDGGGVGRMILVPGDEVIPREVVGILADIRYRGLNRPVLPQYHVPFSQAPRRTMAVAVRATAPLGVTEITRTVASIDPTLPVYDVVMLSDLMRQSIASQRAMTTTVALFGGLAVALAAVGLHGIIATGVRERRREIGIRMAIGATASQVRRLFLRQGMTIAMLAVGLGLAASHWAVRWSQGQLFGLQAPGPVLLAAVAAMVLGIALAATWLPARVACRVNPVESLRD